MCILIYLFLKKRRAVELLVCVFILSVGKKKCGTRDTTKDPITYDMHRTTAPHHQNASFSGNLKNIIFFPNAFSVVREKKGVGFRFCNVEHVDIFVRAKKHGIFGMRLGIHESKVVFLRELV